MKAVGFIGAGNMARALAAAVKAGFADITIHASDISADAKERFLSDVPEAVLHDTNADVVAQSDVVFVAVKPQVLADALDDLADCEGLFVSIAAGIRLNRLYELIPRAHWIRVMPNTPSLVGEMAAGYAVGTGATPEEAEIVSKLLGTAGVARRVDESDLDAVTGLSGSGPAFVARLIESFIEAGTELGLNAGLARDLALKTFRGTAELLTQTGMTPDELVTMVSSPNGTTVAGRSVLESSDYREVLKSSIKKAAERSKELGT